MVRAFVAILTVVGVYQIVAMANGAAVPAGPSSSPSASSPSRTLTPEELAVEAYNSGISRRDRAAKAETQALKEKKDSDKLKNEKKAREEYGKALKDFEKAAKLNPRCRRPTTAWAFPTASSATTQKALENYDKALQLAPKFPDAIEYRGEAYLALNRIDDAKQAYLTLFAMDRKQADSLMAAMKEYVAKKKVDPAGADASALSALESWITERAGVAEQTKQMALNAKHGSWR